MKYTVCLVVAEKYVTVEAPSEEEAKELVLMECEPASLCHQCSSEAAVCDPYVVSVDEA